MWVKEFLIYISLLKVELNAMQLYLFRSRFVNVWLQIHRLVLLSTVPGWKLFSPLNIKRILFACKIFRMGQLVGAVPLVSHNKYLTYRTGVSVLEAKRTLETTITTAKKLRF